MTKISTQAQALEDAVADFMQAFELVFHNDWDLTVDRCQDDLFIKKSGTFLAPEVEDESNNWANRGSLLASYRRLRSLMKEQGISTQLPLRPDAQQ